MNNEDFLIIDNKALKRIIAQQCMINELGGVDQLNTYVANNINALNPIYWYRYYIPPPKKCEQWEKNYMKIFKKKFYIEDDEYGKHIRITSEFNYEIINYIKKNSVNVVSVDYFEGGYVPDHKILTQIPDKVTGIDTIDYEYDFSYIYHLKNLKYFRFLTYTRNPIDFSNFPNLEKLIINWWPQAKHISKCSKLKILSIGSYKGKTFEEFSNLINLEKFGLGGAVSSLLGIENLQKLKSLHLHYCRNLLSLNGIEKLTNLEKLDISSINKKIGDISILANLTNLKELNLDDCGKIKSLKPIENLKDLEILWFAGDTIIEDGDLEFLRNFKNLVKIAFANRRHYSLKCEELPGPFHNPNFKK